MRVRSSLACVAGACFYMTLLSCQCEPAIPMRAQLGRATTIRSVPCCACVTAAQLAVRVHALTSTPAMLKLTAALLDLTSLACLPAPFPPIHVLPGHTASRHDSPARPHLIGPGLNLPRLRCL